MSMDDDKTEKARAPFPQPGKNMAGKPLADEAGAPGDPSRGPGKRKLERENATRERDDARDASGPAKDTAPQQSRETKRRQH